MGALLYPLMGALLYPLMGALLCPLMGALLYALALPRWSGTCPHLRASITSSMALSSKKRVVWGPQCAHTGFGPGICWCWPTPLLPRRSARHPCPCTPSVSQVRLPFLVLEPARVATFLCTWGSLVLEPARVATFLCIWGSLASHACTIQIPIRPRL